MGKHGDLIVECAVVIPLIVLLLVCAWKYWQGKWLRSIAGNTFATDEEMKNPYQKRMGRRVALAAFASALAMADFLALVIFSKLGNAFASDILEPGIIVTIAVIAGSCMWAAIASWRDGQAMARKAVAGNPQHAKEYEPDKRQVLTPIVIILSIVAIELGALFFVLG